MNMKKKKTVVILSVLLLLVATVLGGFNLLKMDLISDRVVTEIGESLSTLPSDYAKGNISNAKVDFSAVDFDKVGLYKASLANKHSKLTFEVEIVDTTPPYGEAREELSFQTNQEFNAGDLVTNILDKSYVTVSFPDGTDTHSYSSGGEQLEQVKLVDEAGNETVIDVTLQIVADTIKPELHGVTDIKIYENEQIDYMYGVKATDDRDGDITDKIIVDKSQVNIDKPGVYKISYSVSDSFNNTMNQEAMFTILEDKAPILHGLNDKIVYINESIDYLKGVTAYDERDGDVTESIDVDKHLVDLSRAGQYKVVYTAVDSTGHTAQESIKITVKEKATTKTPGRSKNINNENQSSDSMDSTEKTTSKKSKTTKSFSNSDSSGFEFHQVAPSGKSVKGDIDAGGKQGVGTWD